MPLFGGTFSHHSRHHGGTDSAPPSRPGSRAPSPTRLVTRHAPPYSATNTTASGSSSALPLRPGYNSTASTSTLTGSTTGGGSTGTSYTGTSALGFGSGGAGAGAGTNGSGSGTPAGSAGISVNTAGIDSSDLDVEPPSPAYGPYTPASDMAWTPSFTSSGANTPGGYFGASSSASSVYGVPQAHPVEIVLDADHLVMRGQGGDMNPAYLSGRLELELTESTNIREINMTLVGKAKVQFTDFSASSAKNHHFTHPVYHYDWSFLAGDKRHTHTLKAGHHSWPFQLALNGDLPSTIHTYNGEALIQYKLRATVVRSGFTHSNWQSAKMFYLQRTYTPDALEFNQTLEIENTWPGKIMYSLTLPYKAYAAGDDIPVNVKFMPLAKGVRVTAVNSVLKEYTMVHTRHSTHSDSRVAASCKHELANGQAKLVQDDAARPPAHSLGAWSGYSSRRGSVDPIRLASQGASGEAGPSSANRTDEELAQEASDIMIGDDEVNTAISIRVPAWTTPSHSIHPLFVTHKLKWSCTISNPDGHISELRCALPILILDHSLLEEARAAGASTRALLFGGGENQDVAQVDLPSYSNHVYDRVAADSGPATGYTSRSSRTPTGHHTPASTGTGTPPQSRPPSRPASPTRRATRLDDAGLNNPPRPELPSGTDTELLRALGALELHAQSPSPTHTPPESMSRVSSRPLSRRSSHILSGRSSIMGSRVGSRAGSRASSPERGHGHSHSHSHATSAGSGSPSAAQGEERRPSMANRLHLPSFKPLSSISKPILRNSSGVNLHGQNGADDAPIARNASFPALSMHGSGPADRLAGSGNHVSFHPSTANVDGSTRRRGVNFHLGSSSSHANDSGSGPGHASGPSSPIHSPDFGAQAAGWEAHRVADPMLLTPSYEIAARGFASAMDTGPPTYDASNLEMARTRSQTDLARAHRSDTALVNMGMDAEAAADAEHRAADAQDRDGPAGVDGGRGAGQGGEMVRQIAPGTPADEEGQITF